MTGPESSLEIKVLLHSASKPFLQVILGVASPESERGRVHTFWVFQRVFITKFSNSIKSALVPILQIPTKLSRDAYSVPGRKGNEMANGGTRELRKHE